MDQSRAVTRATCSPGTSRSASGIELAPERRMSSCVTTKTAAVALEAGSGRREVEVMRIRASSSISRSATSGAAAGSWAGAGDAIASAAQAATSRPGATRPVIDR
jgi:hypothetical protein